MRTAIAYILKTNDDKRITHRGLPSGRSVSRETKRAVVEVLTSLSNVICCDFNRDHNSFLVLARLLWGADADAAGVMVPPSVKAAQALPALPNSMADQKTRRAA